MPISRLTPRDLSFNQVLLHLAETGREEEARELWREIPRTLSRTYLELADSRWLDVQRMLIEVSNAEVMSLMAGLEGGDEVIVGDALDPADTAKLIARNNSAWNLFKLSQVGRA